MNEPDWLALCRRVVAAHRQIFERYTSSAARTEFEGVGSGGDRTLVIDRLCEEAAIAELEELAAQGHALTVISEELGQVDLGPSDAGSGQRRWLVIDPIDGSLNARRTIPAHSFCLAVASGETMERVEFGYVYDFGSGEEFEAGLGKGARLNGAELSVASAVGSGSRKLEVVGIESAEPGLAAPVMEALDDHVHRLRAVGSIAITLCQVAAGRFDGMLSMRSCRSVDVAAAQLIAREAGAEVELGPEGVEGAGFGLDLRFPIRAATDVEGLGILRRAQDSSPGIKRASE